MVVRDKVAAGVAEDIGVAAAVFSPIVVPEAALSMTPLLLRLCRIWVAARVRPRGAPWTRKTALCTWRAAAASLGTTWVLWQLALSAQQGGTAQRRGCLLLRAVVCAARATTAPALRGRLLPVMGPALLVIGALRAKQPQRATDLVTRATTAQCQPRRPLTRRAQRVVTAQRRGCLLLRAVARAARATTAPALRGRLLPATVLYPAATSPLRALPLLQGRASAQQADTV